MNVKNQIFLRSFFLEIMKNICTGIQTQNPAAEVDIVLSDSPTAYRPQNLLYIAPRTYYKIDSLACRSVSSTSLFLSIILTILCTTNFFWSCHNANHIVMLFLMSACRTLRLVLPKRVDGNIAPCYDIITITVYMYMFVIFIFSSSFRIFQSCALSGPE